MKDLLEDIRTLTTIKYSVLFDLTKTVESILAHNCLESKLECKNSTTLDIGIGTLNIDFSDNAKPTYTFTPSQRFNNAVITTLQSNESPINTKANDKIAKRIEFIYKELM